MLSGLLALPWWGYVIVALVLTHITIASVTIFLHRHQAHRAVDLHPLPSHFFRFWLWLTTGMVTKEWVAIHRKHHAKCETEDDPHSPQQLGINRVLWGGVGLYRAETLKPETMEKYGAGVPDDWVERHVYARFNKYGIFVMAGIDIALFGVIPGALIFGVQMAWIPFWAAGVINGIGHFWGYRNFACEDASRNIVPWGIVVGGEELHNNHHAYASSAKFSNKWYEFDIGWGYIRLMQAVGLAKVKKVAPRVTLTPAKPTCDLANLQAIITHRYDVMARYATHVGQLYREEAAKITSLVPSLDRTRLNKAVRHALHLDEQTLKAEDRAELDHALRSSPALETAFAMRRDLAKLWERSTASKEQLLKHLQDWCGQAETSGIRALEEFSLRLRRYA